MLRRRFGRAKGRRVDASVVKGGYNLGNIAGGLNNMSGLLTRGHGVDPRVAATTLLQAGSVAASGAAAFAAATSPAGPGGAIAAAVFGTVAAGVRGGLNAYDAQKTIALLKQCL